MSDFEASLIIVNWNGAKLIDKCLESIEKTCNISMFEVIILDNDSKEDDIILIEGFTNKYNRLNLNIIKNGENLGFGKACNIGAKSAKGKYLVFVNPDTILIEDSIKILIDDLKNENNVALVAPKIIDEQLNTSLSPSVFPNILNRIIGGESLIRFARILKFKKIGFIYINLDEASYPDWIVGAFFILPKKIFSDIGGFDENIFMYWDEIDLCKKIITSGYKVKYNPSTKVIHIGGGTSKAVPQLTIERQMQSEFYFFKKWNSLEYSIKYTLINAYSSFIKGIIFLLLGYFKNRFKIKSIFQFDLYKIRMKIVKNNISI
ncbi:MAG: glycosyltransferase family 2 protein [Candidatus Sericytochromatia bacterium]